MPLPRRRVCEQWSAIASFYRVYPLRVVIGMRRDNAACDLLLAPREQDDDVLVALLEPAFTADDAFLLMDD